MQAKVKERQFLRKLVAKNLPYDAIDKAMVLKYIRWGQEMNPILDDPAYASETQNVPYFSPSLRLVSEEHTHHAEGL
jgi:hypothetical protein